MARRERAMARFILKRVGIPPLLSALALPMLVSVADSAHAQAVPSAAAAPSAVRATSLATARATIVSSAARIEQGALRMTFDGSSAALLPQPQRSIGSCDPVAQAAANACRMIVYDLP